MAKINTLVSLANDKFTLEFLEDSNLRKIPDWVKKTPDKNNNLNFGKNNDPMKILEQDLSLRSQHVKNKDPMQNLMQQLNYAQVDHINEDYVFQYRGNI